MHIKRVELKEFKRFTHLVVENIPETAKMVILVGPNGSGKTSFLESMNHFYKYSGYRNTGDFNYLYKAGKDSNDRHIWSQKYAQSVDIDFYEASFPKVIGASDIRGHFYFRSAYRNEPNFHIESMNKQNDPRDNIRLESLIQNDQTVSNNYQRLVANTISGVYNENNDDISVKNLRNELIGKIQQAINRVFEDLTFSTIGDPLSDGNFYFTKGVTKNFYYQNLSAGEKSAFDLILDMVIKSRYYTDAIYCIDEPELHMHTILQGKVLRELYNLTPDTSQLWVSTHSIGMLQEAEDIERENSGTVVFLDFSNKDFDEEQIIHPAQIGKAVLNKFYELAFGDFAKLILPKTVIFCEGNPNGKSRKDYDKSIYTIIFENTHPEAYFISGGSCSELENIESKYGEILGTLLKNTNIIKIVDRDDRSTFEVGELLNKGIKTLTKRHLESYLLDDEIIKKLCDINNQSEKYNSCIKLKEEAVNNSILRGNPDDDIKSARGDICNGLRQTLNLKQCGNTADSFIRDTMAPLVSQDTNIYQILEKDIFG